MSYDIGLDKSRRLRIDQDVYFFVSNMIATSLIADTKPFHSQEDILQKVLHETRVVTLLRDTGLRAVGAVGIFLLFSKL